MSDDSNAAEQLDPSVLGEEVGDDERPADDFPPEEPLGVDDPSIIDQGMIARDDVESREARRDHATRDDSTRSDDAAAPGLLDPAEGEIDTEAQLLADASDTAEQAPEAAAVHRVPEDDAEAPGGPPPD